MASAEKFRKELYKYSFYIFLISFVVAKAWGLNAIRKGYTEFAFVGCIFWCISMICRKYGKWDIIKVIALMGVGLLSLWFSRKIGAIMPFMVIVAMKDIDVDKVIEVFAKTWVVTFLVKIIGVSLRIIPSNEKVYHKVFIGDITIYDYGYWHANFFSIAYFISIVLLCYLFEERLKWWHYITMILLSLVMFRLTLSFTGVIANITAVSGFFIIKQCREKSAIRIFERIMICISGIPLLLSFLTAFLYREGTAFWNKIYDLTNTRVKWNFEYMRAYPLTLFGQIFDGRVEYEVLDNAYLFVLQRYGVVFFILFVAGYALLIYRFYEQRDTKKLFICVLFLFYGFIEQYIQNPFMNFSIIYFAMLVWRDVKYDITLEK